LLGLSVQLGEAPLAKTNQYTQAEDAKTEMSLVHFTLTNPGWKPSHHNEKYLTGLRSILLSSLFAVLPDPGSRILCLFDSWMDPVSGIGFFSDPPTHHPPGYRSFCPFVSHYSYYLAFVAANLLSRSGLFLVAIRNK
jgi:hypothetical protein